MRAAALGMLGGVALLSSSPDAQQTQPPASPQSERPVFRSGVQTIEVDVRVYDKDGHFVADLTPADFEVLEDGVRQSIQSLFVVLTSAATPASQTAAAPEGRATQATPIVSARQTWIFVFDLNHLAPGRSFDSARKAVREFIASRLSPGDLAGIVAGDEIVNNRLTSVREELLAAVERLKPRGDARSRFIAVTREWPRFADEEELLRVARNERDAVARVVARARADDPDGAGDPETLARNKALQLQQEIHHATTQTLAALEALASGLARIPGPKSIVFLSDGFTVFDMDRVLQKVTDRATRSGARVYAIDVRGLGRGMQGFLEQKVADDPYTAAPMKIDAVADGPNALAADTGGLFIRNENNIGRALQRVYDDAARCYVLTYHASNTNFDGRFRRIVVRVNRPDVRVRARRGYLALEPAKMTKPEPVK